MSGISFSLSHPQLHLRTMKCRHNPSSSSLPFPTFAAHNNIPCSSPNIIFKTLVLRGNSGRLNVQCSSKGSGSPGFDETDLKNVVDAFFLGKALAEVISERVESTVGELLSTFGRLQAEQQKQVQEFQEEVLERAKREKEKAARESLEAQGVVPNPTLVTVQTVDISSEVPPSPTSQVTIEVSSTPSASTAASSSDDPNENNPSHQNID
ncbi:hypothetical protein Sjap_008456 [Stephania japonica]|uniref:Uncharacterized protein n=1 Tax=Stephania japonica TaxID=461633 RepID=A0AAP0JPN6_9MAGN